MDDHGALCSLQSRDDVAFVRISGDIYLDNHEEFDAFLSENVSPRFSKVVLDATHVKTICSAALGAIVKAHKRAREAGGEVVFVNVQRKVQTLLEITRLASVLKLLDTDQAALDYLSSLP
ncbi:MAG: STAS domain-containing protein [Candidatus Wallbacteria bacterium]|nr:STAS domain-containing protein [Candidatus Wallbacteria bacterium]